MEITWLSFPSVDDSADCGWNSGALGRRDMIWDVATIFLENILSIFYDIIAYGDIVSLGKALSDKKILHCDLVLK